MFSATDITGISMKCWCTIPIPWSIASPGPEKRTRSPLTKISPSSGEYSPYRMFISVDLPAPFSPSSACTSPRARPKSMWSFARIPGNSFVIPFSSRTVGAASAIPGDSMAEATPGNQERVGLQGRGRLQLPRDQLLLDLVHPVDELLRHLRAHLPDADALVLEVEDRVGAALELPVHHRFGGQEHRLVDALDGAREDVLAETRLVAIDADPPLVALLRRVERAEAAPAGHLEDDLRALRDLVERDLLALVLRDEVLRVADQDLGRGDALPRPGPISSDEDVHRRQLDPTDRADHLLAALLLGHERSETADHVAVLVRREGQALDVGILRERRRVHRVVDDREARVRIPLRRGVDRLRQKEPDTDRQVESFPGQGPEVRDVVARLTRLDGATGDPELVLPALEPLQGGLVEGPVVEAADVADETDAGAFAARGLLRRRCAPAGFVSIVVSAAGEADRQEPAGEDRREPLPRAHRTPLCRSGGRCYRGGPHEGRAHRPALRCLCDLPRASSEA